MFCSRAWYGIENGMERKFRYGIWKMPEWNGRQSSILPYQFHTRFRALYLRKNTYRCRVVIIILSQKYWTSISTHIICRQIAVLWLWTLRKQCTYCIIVSKLQFNCSIDVTVDDLDRFDLLFFFILRLTICPVVNFVFLHRQKNSYLQFHPRFSLILCILLVFKLIVILFGVKVWYFYYGKCSSWCEGKLVWQSLIHKHSQKDRALCLPPPQLKSYQW